MNVRAEGEPLMIEDTVHMTHFVHEFYLSNMQAMKEAYEMEMAAQIEEAKVRNIVGKSRKLPNYRRELRPNLLKMNRRNCRK